MGNFADFVPVVCREPMEPRACCFTLGCAVLFLARYAGLGFDLRHGGGSAPSAAVQRRAQPETAPEAEQSLLCGISAAPRGDLGDGDCSERSADAAQAVEVLFVNRKKQTDRVNVGLFFAGFKRKFCILILASVPCASSVRTLSVCKIYSQIALVQLYTVLPLQFTFSTYAGNPAAA